MIFTFQVRFFATTAVEEKRKHQDYYRI